MEMYILKDSDYADNIALLNCAANSHMQEKTNKINQIAKYTGLKINTIKTKLMSLKSKSV